MTDHVKDKGAANGDGNGLLGDAVVIVRLNIR
jgi:hypothetical protein